MGISGRRVATDWRVVVDNVDLSEWGFHVTINDEKDQVDASGFGGKRTFLQGVRTQSVDVEFRAGDGTNEPYFKLRDLYESGSQFPFYVQPVNDGGTVSDTNWQYGGSLTQVFQLPREANLNDVEDMSVTFAPASNEGFSYGTAGTPAFGTV